MIRYLVVGPSWVGDMVMAQSLLKLLKQQGNCKISVLAPGWTEPLLSRMPEVDQSVSMPAGHGQLALAARWRLGRALMHQFDHAIVLPGSYKSALIPWFARVEKRTGFVGEQRYGLLNDIRPLDKEAMPYHLQRVAHLAGGKQQAPRTLEEIPWPTLERDPLNLENLLCQWDIDPNRPIVALCPGAEFGPAKQWPAAYFSSVAKDQHDRGAQVIVLGSEKDAGIAANIMTGAPFCLDLTGKTKLSDVIDLLGAAAHVVSNDSGLMHIACAMGVRVIGIYGSSSNHYTPPLSHRAHSLGLSLDCRPCFQRECPLGHLDCLNKLNPEQVIALLD